MKLYIIEQSFDYGSYVFGVIAKNKEDALVYLKASGNYQRQFDEDLYIQAEFEIINSCRKEGYVEMYGGRAE